MLKTVLDSWRNHGTKILGFGQVTIGAVTVYADKILTKDRAWIVLMISGLLTAWRGFVNSQPKEDSHD